MVLPSLIAWLATKINCHQGHVIAYLREENRILKAKLKGRRLQLTDTERRRLAVLAHPIERKDFKELSTIATADTLQRWYRRLVVQSLRPTPQGKRIGRPRVAEEIEQLTIRMAHENPSWGYRRIQGSLPNVGYDLDKTTVRNILRRHHIDPAPIQGSADMSWSQFVKLHWEVLAESGYVKDLRSIVTDAWGVALQRVQSLGVWIALRLCMIQPRLSSILMLLTPRGLGLGVGCLTALTPRYVREDRRLEWLNGEAFPPPRIVLIQELDDSLQAMPIKPERSPPGEDVGCHTVAARCLDLGCRASGLRLVMVAQGDEDERDPIGHYRRGTNSVSNPSQIAV